MRGSGRFVFVVMTFVFMVVSFFMLMCFMLMVMFGMSGGITTATGKNVGT